MEHEGFQLPLTFKIGVSMNIFDLVPGNSDNQSFEKAKNSKTYGKGYKGEADNNGDLYEQFCSIAMNSSDFVRLKIARPETIISPWLTDGSLTEIYAPRGVGKTFLSLIS